jgi:hypothetical protein
MLTINFPQILPTIRKLPGGLLPINVPDQELPSLVVKVPKEYILAAKLNASFKIYLTPVQIKDQTTYGLVVAFFDDGDQPLAVRIPTVNDEGSKLVFDTLKKEKIKVHFFDELAREYLVYSAAVTIPQVTREHIDKANWLEPSITNARLIIEGISANFGLRTPQDDDEAIVVSLNESLYGQDLFLLDLQPENHIFKGAQDFSHTVLEREEPGHYQEKDIIQVLQQIFSPDQIYLSPKRTNDKEEVCDILLVTETTILIIQAKDSPNIERISKQSLARKRSNIMRALRKAVEQVKGAVGYIRRQPNRLEFLIDERMISINIGDRKLKTLVIVKELFNDQFKEYSPIIFNLVHERSVDCIALDYPELYSYCNHLKDESDFFKAYDLVMSNARERGEYPRLRFGLSET